MQLFLWSRVKETWNLIPIGIYSQQIKINKNIWILSCSISEIIC